MANKTVGRYEIQSELGRGGMAIVYLAHDPNFRRNVALKLITGNLEENLVFRERFEREAHLIAKIEHPAIVPVYDYGEQDHQLYLVMRYMSGGALANKLKEGVLTLADATQIISQIAPALDAVHAEGIVHRDLKPGNILLDNFGNPAISDFGIAHLTVATTDLTGSAIVGTPSYMSPEQVRGDEELDGRSDVYALGVILFEMLTGRGPFQAKTPLSLAMKHLTDSLPSIHSFRPNLPIELELILNKAMAKDREMRYSSASELARELRAIPDQSPNTGLHTSAPVALSQPQGTSAKSDTGHASQSALSTPPSTSPSVIAPPHPTATQPKRPPRRMAQVGILAGLALLLVIICGSAGLFGTFVGLGLPGLFQEGDQTVPAATPSPDTILFSEDFSNPSSGWPTTQDTRGGYRYQQEEYHMFVDQKDVLLWAKTNKQTGDASISVDTKPAKDDVLGYYGLLCRLQDDQNFYYFVAMSNGGYNIGKFKNAEFQPLYANSWQTSDAIHQGTQTNHLRADCVGDRLRFYVNNVMLGEVVDADFESGLSGILVASLDTQRFEMIFDNFLITKRGQ